MRAHEIIDRCAITYTPLALLRNDDSSRASDERYPGVPFVPGRTGTGTRMEYMIDIRYIYYLSLVSFHPRKYY